MQSFLNIRKCAWFILLTAVLIICPLDAEQTKAGAEGPTIFSVTTTADSDAGSMRQAILDANALSSGNDFKIVIGVEGTLSTLSALPVLQVDGRSGWIQSNPNATIPGFSCVIKDGGHLTLQNATVDNGAYDLEAIHVSDDHSGNSLLLSGSNRIIGSVSDFDRNIGLSGTLTIDKVPGGSDMGNTLILTDADVEIAGLGPLQIKGGTIESYGVFVGIVADNGVLVESGKLIATGNSFGILSDTSDHSEVVIKGGTVMARGNLDIWGYENIFNGGSIDAKVISGHYPVDATGNRVYLVTVTVGETPVANTEVACSVNGGASFTCITDAEGKLYLWMPEGDGAAEIDVGGTVYRASGTVINNDSNTMLALPDPVVTQVSIVPSSATAVSGSSVRFFARVEGFYNPPQTVMWAVHNAHQGTTIDGSGLLTISAYESSRTLLVTATSTYNTSKSGTAQVAVLSATGIVLGVVFLLLLLVLLFAFLELGNPFQRR